MFPLRSLRDQFTIIEMTILKGLSLYLFFYFKPLCEMCEILSDICLQPFLHAQRVSSPPFLFTSLCRSLSFSLSVDEVFFFSILSGTWDCRVIFLFSCTYPDYSFLSYFSYFTSSFQLLRPFFDELLLLTSKFLSLVKNKFLFSGVRKSSFNLLKVGQGNFPSLPHC